MIGVPASGYCRKFSQNSEMSLLRGMSRSPLAPSTIEKWPIVNQSMSSVRSTPSSRPSVASSRKVLLITDRRFDNFELSDELPLLARCSVAPLVEASIIPPANWLLIVTDVALDNASSVRLLRLALARHRTAGTPMICLLPRPSHHLVTQAKAIGASEVVIADVKRDELLARVAQLTEPESCAETRNRARLDLQAATQGAAKVGLALSEMMIAAESGMPVALQTLSSGSDAVLDAVVQADIRAWLDVVWTYDDSTFQHCLLVTGLAAAFAVKLGFNEADRKRLTQAALLHDIGKAKVPQSILNKPGRLTDDEMVLMREHSSAGYDMLVRQGGFDRELLSVVRHHHEYLDGSGYPDGLRGDKIPDLVRLVTICDIYAALIERRVYKPALPSEKAFKIMFEMGDKLDRALLTEFHKLIGSSLKSG